MTTDTRRDSYEAAQATSPTLRNKVLAYLTAGHESTADEIAAALGETPWAIRPRVTELLHLGEIEDSGERRPNVHSGKAAKVWRVKRKEETPAVLRQANLFESGSEEYQ